jgi:hypothetical protein
MIIYDSTNLEINGNPFLFVPIEINGYDITGYYFGKFKAEPIDPNDFSPRIKLIFDDYSPYFTIDDCFTKSITLELIEDLRIMGHKIPIYEYKRIIINLDSSNPESQKIINYYSNYECPMPLEKMDEYGAKLYEIKEDFK